MQGHGTLRRPVRTSGRQPDRPRARRGASDTWKRNRTSLPDCSFSCWPFCSPALSPSPRKTQTARHTPSAPVSPSSPVSDTSTKTGHTAATTTTISRNSPSIPAGNTNSFPAPGTNASGCSTTARSTCWAVSSVHRHAKNSSVSPNWNLSSTTTSCWHATATSAFRTKTWTNSVRSPSVPSKAAMKPSCSANTRAATISATA